MTNFSIFKKIFGNSNDRLLKTALPFIDKINSFSAEMKKISDDSLSGKTGEFRQRIENGEDLDSVLPESFAVVREASERTIGLRPFDVQLIGGYFLHKGYIAEMKTGEGKTLTATLPLYLNALEGNGSHLVTVNDYLAKRDAEWMGKVFSYLGLSVGVIAPDMDEGEKISAYTADVTYATNNELGFDYLRDNMKSELSEISQRAPHYAIVDEVDSILIDEARTPLIISGPTNDKSELYTKVNSLIHKLDTSNFELDEKTKTGSLTDSGNQMMETLLREQQLLASASSLYDPENTDLVHHVNQALIANKLFKKESDYIVRGGEVILIDEFTGRMMAGRRLSNGLHQAIEAKEKLSVKPENTTLASVTFQNYFRLYKKLAGMTGTAITEADEFSEIYGLGVVAVPTNMPIARLDEDDQVYRTKVEKYNAVISEIKKANAKGQPILVGTTSIDKSEEISKLLKKENIKHNVLNARYHEKEAEIISFAGTPKAVTIATNMAGRGTDIQLGGNVEMQVKGKIDTNDPKFDQKKTEIERQVLKDREKVVEAGGLYVLATERHESRRIDNQLRGRSGRQGDPGKTTFFLSLDDDLLRIFGSDKLDGMLSKLGLKDGESIAHPWVSKALERAQGKVEARNFDLRKNILKYDDVVNVQRKEIFSQRRNIMETLDVSELFENIYMDIVEDIIVESIPEGAFIDQWDINGLETKLKEQFNLTLQLSDFVKKDGILETEIRDIILSGVHNSLEKKTNEVGAEAFRMLQKQILLQVVDHCWSRHLSTLDHLRSVIGFRGYAQRDPLNEYKQEAFILFEGLLEKIKRETIKVVFFAKFVSATGVDSYEKEEISSDLTTGKSSSQSPAFLTKKKVRRNSPCPCGSGKKFKHCCGAI
ncbi:preprotein translocase subunit SecA [Paracoccaceae bacterium]|nr:preprotein translocase subunit SecA [Paracoccaceae bacterium]